MANTTRLILTELLILVLGLTLFPTNMLTSNAQQKPDQDAVARRKELLDRKLAQDRRQARLDQMIATFKKTKELLTKKGVPFEPAVLMTPNWRDTLAPHFEHIADMQTVRIGPRRLKGVQMAHTLYLPEEVELVGDTVILARNVIFEGRDAVIRGSFSIALYPVDQTALLGSTLEQALQRTSVRFLNANFSSATTRALPTNLPVIKGGSLTIDTSGFGYKQWLEQQAAMKRRKGPFVNATFVPQGGEEKNGAPGQPGKNIFSAADGSPVTAVGATGSAGICGSTSTVNGQIGGIGPTGNNGQKATENGGEGGSGEPAGHIIASIPDKPVEFYVFSAVGGDGAPGGQGGAGGWGSKGGRGGQGGGGADCPCTQGGSGFGGPGGPGGPGGSGADGTNGGKGGSGGDGGSITVSYPMWYGTSTIQPFTGGGSRNVGGAPGIGGNAGDGGDGGPGGLSGGATICPNPGWGGNTGTKGTPGLPGNAGTPGPQGDRDGVTGPVSLIPRRYCEFVDDCSIYGDPPLIWRDYPNCRCERRPSPIIFDINGDGFSMTDAAHGVAFDLDADGPAERLSWTAAGSDDAFLALDLNQNGMIDSGAELFGNYTPQPHSVSPNGFLALAEFDKEENGGIADGTIDTEDAVYARLLLWRDTNHDGKSDTGELRPLAQSGVTALSLDYKQSKQRDEHDNLFYYRSRIQVAKHSRAEHWAYDVFLVPAL
ncbi:MAG TPA: hypothetical protein VFS76_26570 [Pyrinomonadaceae bacterium]|nr:hypothetical protein [Pyrinomonadaceae bacterium]